MAGFHSNIKEIEEQSPRKTLQVSAGKTLLFVSTDATIWCKQIVYMYQCGKQIQNTGIFSVEKIFCCMKTVRIGNIYHFSGLENRKQFHNKVLHGFFRELL